MQRKVLKERKHVNIRYLQSKALKHPVRRNILYFKIEIRISS